MTSLISGGFDPLHVGHLDLIHFARSYGPVTVALNSDRWLLDKKGYVFMSWDDRAKILRSIKGVDSVVDVYDMDGHIGDILEHLQPSFFVNGGDRKTPNEKEHAMCLKYGIVEIFGGDKIRSSQELVEAAK